MSGQDQTPDEVREIYEHRHDPGEWSEEAVPVSVRPARTSVVSVRLPIEEFDVLEAAANAAGESLSEYVRRAIEVRRVGNPVPTGLQVSSLGAMTMQVTSSMSAAWTETRATVLQDFPTNLSPVGR